ncbi:MAG: carotenoid oxygenase family protein, partial [Halioglobus sp.]|nr:carotenoid oxygenase family protein [Halioglobus sp.]
MLLDRKFSTTESCIGPVTVLDDAPEWIYQLDNPYLHGMYAPTLNELVSENLIVEGELPSDLVGAYFRNGPNPLLPPMNRYHPFDGDGMVHGVYFKDGLVSYRNRYVQTAALQSERSNGQSISPGVMGPFDYGVSRFGMKDTSNTDLFSFGGDLISLWYNAGDPHRLDAMSLETKSEFALLGRAQRRMSAHSKVDWATGELLFFDYGDELPYLTFGVADANFKLLHEVPIDLPGPRLPHDIGFTTHYAILHDLPFFHDIAVLRKHKYRVLT